MQLERLRNYFLAKIDKDIGDLIKNKRSATYSIEGKMLLLALTHAMNQMADVLCAVLLKLELETLEQEQEAEEEIENAHKREN